MAKTSPRRPIPPVAPTVKQPLNLWMDEGLIRRLKHLAIDNRISVSDLVSRLALDFIKRKEAR